VIIIKLCVRYPAFKCPSCNASLKKLTCAEGRATHITASRALYFRTRAHTRAPSVGDGVMKKILLATAAAVALMTTNAANAADMGVPVKGRALEPAWNWSGFYAGLNAGYARGTTVWNDLDASFTLGGTLLNESTNGFIGGGQVGYNWQFRHAVVGVETDFNYLSLKQTTGFFDNVPGSGFAKFALTDAVRWLGTVRGRAGLALDNVLIYLTAGLAYGRTEHTVTVVGVPPPVTPTVAHDFSGTKVGAVAGVGTEYALDPRWSVKAEALYVDLGKRTGIFHGGDGVISSTVNGRLETLDTMWIVRGGVNYKFGG
jgi:outer membrane immunogenic protein